MAKVYRAFRCDICSTVCEDNTDDDRGILIAVHCNPTYPATADERARFDDVCDACRTKVVGTLATIGITVAPCPAPAPVPDSDPDSDFREVDEKEPLL